MGTNILIIEDEPAIQTILKELLCEAGYEAETAGDGMEGLAMFQSRHYDLVLLDIMMPKIDGYTVCECIRKTSKIPIIILTALDGETAEIKAFELKADDYITKPFSLKVVLMRVEAVFRRSGPANDAGAKKLRLGRICLDETEHTVSVKERPVELTPIEFELLSVFMHNPGRIFTRDNLLNQAWGYEHIGDEKTVNIHIMNLRRKLGENCIKTVRGIGYKIDKED